MPYIHFTGEQKRQANSADLVEFLRSGSEVRMSNSQGKSFRMTVEGSDFRCAFNWPGTSGRLMMFEAPIDMLLFARFVP